MFRNSQLPPLRLWIPFPFSLALPPERRNRAQRLPKSLNKNENEKYWKAHLRLAQFMAD
jgi:hypothetical protein